MRHCHIRGVAGFPLFYLMLQSKQDQTRVALCKPNQDPAQPLLSLDKAAPPGVEQPRTNTADSDNSVAILTVKQKCYLLCI